MMKLMIIQMIFEHLNKQENDNNENKTNDNFNIKEQRIA